MVSRFGTSDQRSRADCRRWHHRRADSRFSPNARAFGLRLAHRRIGTSRFGCAAPQTSPGARRMKIKFLALVTLTCLILASSAHAVLYSVTDLGTLGGTTSRAYGINNTGTIVGQAYTPTTRDAFSYSGGVMTDLGTLG